MTDRTTLASVLIDYDPQDRVWRVMPDHRDLEHRGYPASTLESARALVAMSWPNIAPAITARAAAYRAKGIA